MPPAFSDPKVFYQQLVAAQARVEQLQLRAGSASSSELAEALAEMSTMLEELSVAQEELREQSEQLLQAHAAAAAERQRYLELFEFAPDGYLVTDAYGAIEEANQAAAELLNVPADWLRHKPLALFIEREQSADFRRRLHQLASAAGETVEWEAPVVPRGRPPIIVQFRVAPAHARIVRGQDELLWRLQDVSARRHAQAEMQQSRDTLRELSQHMDALREDERTRIAREVHDELGSALTAIKMDVAYLRNALAKAGHVEMAERAAMASQAIDATIQTVRQIALELRPAVLDNFGLVAAIDLELQQFQGRSGVVCNLEVTDGERLVPPEVAVAAFRVLQEILTNVVRHAQASQVSVRLAQSGERLVLEVRDDGRGFDQQPTGGLGLIGMRERMRLVGGQVDVQSQPGQGTTVTVTAPLAAAEGPNQPEESETGR